MKHATYVLQLVPNRNYGLCIISLVNVVVLLYYFIDFNCTCYWV